MRQLPLFAAALLVPLLALGAVTDWGLLIGVCVVSAAALVSIGARTPGRPSQSTRLTAVALWGMAGVSLVQLVPLPPTVLRILSRSAAETWSSADLLMGLPPRWHPITLDPPATAFMSVTSIVIALFFMAAATYAGRSVGRVRLTRAVVIAVLVFELFSFAHPVFGLTKLYGVYTPLYVEDWQRKFILSPLLNENHAGAIACVAPPLLIGFALESADTGNRLLALVGAVASSAFAMLMLSRGAIAVLLTELFVMAVYAVMRRGSMRRRLGGALTVTAVLGAAIGGAVHLALDRLVGEAQNRDLTKLKIALRAFTMSRDYFLTGAGRGSFASVFAGYEGDLGGVRRFTHSENWPSQLLADVGYPAATVFVGLLAFALLKSAPGSLRRPHGVGTLVALMGLVVHDLFDFATYFAGGGLVAAGLMAAVVTTNSAGAERRVSSSRVPYVVTGIAVVASFSLLIMNWHHAVDDDTADIATKWQAGTLRESEADIKSALQRHPAEAYFPLLLGIRVLNSPSAAPFLLRAVKLAPSRAQNHFWLARWFLGMGRRGQAWAEYRETIRLAPTFARTVVDDLVRADAPLDDLVSVAFTAEALDYLARQLDARGRFSSATAVDVILTQRFPPALEARLREIERVRSTEPANATKLAELLVRDFPKVSRAHLVYSKLLTSSHEAENALEAGIREVGDQPDLLESLIRLRAARLGPEAVASELERFKEAIARSDRPIASYHALLGDLEIARKRPGAALKHFQDASAASADRDAYLEVIATLAEETEQFSVARTAWARLLELSPEPRYKAALERVERTITVRAAQDSLPGLQPK